MPGSGTISGYSYTPWDLSQAPGLPIDTRSSDGLKLGYLNLYMQEHHENIALYEIFLEKDKTVQYKINESFAFILHNNLYKDIWLSNLKGY